MPIIVNNIKQLYDAVNNPNHAGEIVQLKPGIYPLDTNNRPNKGRLDLQRDMSLLGVQGNRYAAIIDVTGLPFESYLGIDANVETAPIRVGNGYNSIDWLTIRNDPVTGGNIRSLIQSDITTTLTAYIRIRHSYFTGGNVGVCIINRKSDCDNRVLVADISDNLIIQNGMSLPTGAGIRIQNSHGVKNAIIRARLEGNHVMMSPNGFVSFNASVNGCKIWISSRADRMMLNGVGLFLVGGHNIVGSKGTDNVLFFEAEDTHIEFNHGQPTPRFMNGGVFAAAGLVSLDPKSLPDLVNNNQLEMLFRNSVIANNIGTDQINYFGAYSERPELAGKNNIAHLRFLLPSPVVSFSKTDCQPFEPAATNLAKFDW